MHSRTKARTQHASACDENHDANAYSHAHRHSCISATYLLACSLAGAHGIPHAARKYAHSAHP
eukprot:4089307-Pleurochrysis_carterae.AAC.1